MSLVVRRTRRAAAPSLEAASVLVLAAGALASSACRPTLPDPAEAVRAYAAAAERGDASALRGMLDTRGQRSLSLDDVKRVVADTKAELAEAGKAAAAAKAPLVRTSLRFADGETAAVVFEGGAYRVAFAEALPAEPRSPLEALSALRRVLARRSYSGLLRLLTPATRAAIEGDLRAIVEGLAYPDGLDVKVEGDAATVVLVGGHAVKLRRDAGVWRVEDFD